MDIFKPLKIMLTNDDGIHAPGLWALYDALADDHHVAVVAPDRERSAVGHGITLHRPLRANDVTINGGGGQRDYQGRAVNGTPADCVKLALFELLEEKPDIVISGINPGANVGPNLNYSGTVAAAKEAAMNGFSAVAVSIQGFEDLHFEAAARFVADLLPDLPALAVPRGTFLNINVPNLPRHRIRGARVSRQGIDPFREKYEMRRDPRQRAYYWPGYEEPPTYRHADADGVFLTSDYISITPVQCDMTDHDTLKRLKTWDFDNNGKKKIAV